MRYFDYSPMYYHASFWQGGLISLIINVLIWALMISLFVFLIRKISGRTHGGCCEMRNHHDRALRSDNSYIHIIKERYAKGEIDKKQFEQLKKDLTEDDSDLNTKDEIKE